MNSDFPDDALRRLLAAEEERRKILELHAAPSESMRKMLGQLLSPEVEQISRNIRDLDAGWRSKLADSVQGTLDTHVRAMHAAAGPLLRLRVEILYEAECARIAAVMPKNPAITIADSLVAQHAKLLADIAASAKLTTSIADQVQSSFGEQTRNRISQFAKPFALVDEHLRRELAAVKGMFDAGEWARRLGMPMIDAASIATVARVWGAEGALRNLREHGGIDTATLRLIADALEVEAESQGQQDERALGKEGGGVSIDTLLAILAIVLTLLIWRSQNKDSEEMEARLRADNRALTAEIRKSEERTAQLIMQLTRAMETVIQNAQAPRQIQFVTRSRGAAIKTKKGGRAVLAEALPGQVVTLIAEEGKWIEISYFDFTTGKQHSGWALKKYFVRANSRPIEEVQE